MQFSVCSIAPNFTATAKPPSGPGPVASSSLMVSILQKVIVKCRQHFLGAGQKGAVPQSAAGGVSLGYPHQDMLSLGLPQESPAALHSSSPFLARNRAHTEVTSLRWHFPPCLEALCSKPLSAAGFGLHRALALPSRMQGWPAASNCCAMCNGLGKPCRRNVLHEAWVSHPPHCTCLSLQASLGTIT